MKWPCGFIFLISFVSFAQEAKFILKKGKGFNEEYFVLTADNKTKNGKYVKYKNDLNGIAILESGNFKNGNKEGLWEFYYDTPGSFIPTKNRTNSLKEKGYYVNNKKNGVWTSFYLDTAANEVSTQKYGKEKKADSLGISIAQNDLRPKQIGQFLNDKRVGEWIAFDFSRKVCQRYSFTKSKLLFDSSIKDSLKYNQGQPIFLGGTPCLNDYLSREFNFKGIAVSIKKDSITVIAEFSISPDRRVENIKVFQSNGSLQIEKEVLRIVALLDDKWIPAMQGGQFIKSNCKIAMDVIRKVATERYQSFRISFRPIIE